MKLTAGLLAHAVRALQHISRTGGSADVQLKQYFRRYPKLGAQDRHGLSELVYLTIKQRRFLAWLSQREDPTYWLIAALVLLQQHSPAALQAALNTEQLAWAEQLTMPEIMLPQIASNLPDWLWQLLCEQQGQAETQALAASLLQRAPLDLRVNPHRATRAETLATLQATYPEAIATPYAPHGIRLRDPAAISQHPLYQQGILEIQDEGSQLLTHLIEPRRGEKIVDFCAGAGGKSLAMASLMRNSGLIYAWDISAKRLGQLAARMERAQLTNIHAQLITSETDPKISQHAQKCDKVLVDAPCSGLGTLRRNPELKWKLDPAAVAAYATQQQALLQQASKLVRPGGRLIYATCSLLAQENDQVVDMFLTQNPQFSLLAANTILARQQIALATTERLILLPHRHHTDGFYAVALTRDLA